ncbi:ATP-binding cassette domain-containing protein [Haliea sp. E17]|uniref:ATP-binding cassette domain-containing protein n=1 Tax=Haliea sp. E17 TaxID=3401576 RepID=UPI003AAEC340
MTLPSAAWRETGTGAEVLVYRRRWLLILGVAMVFSFVCNLLRLTGPVFILLIHDKVLPSGSTDALLRLFLLVASFFLLMGIVDYARRRIIARLGAQFQEEVETYLFAASPLQSFYSRQARKPVAGLNDIDNLRGFLHSSAMITVLDSLWVPVFLAVVFYFHTLLGLAVVCGILGLLVLAWVRSCALDRVSEKSGAARTNINDLKDSIMTSASVIRALGFSRTFNTRWLESRRVSRDLSVARADWNTLFSVFSRQIRSLIQYSVLAAGAYLALRGELSLGATIASMFLAVRVLVPVENCIQEFPSIRRAMVSWKNLQRIIGRQNPAGGASPGEGGVGGLYLSGVVVKSGSPGQRVLNAIDLEVGPGFVVEINGHSGSGKTVLLETIMGRYAPVSGTVRYRPPEGPGRNRGYPVRDIGYLPETVEFISGTLEENIAGFDPDLVVADVVAAARQAGIHDAIASLPQGYQTRIGPRAEPFSRGQRYRLGLARALYQSPQLLLIDEPDALVTSGGADSLLNEVAARQVDNGGSLLLASRVPIAGFQPDRRYFLKRGVLAEDVSLEKKRERAMHD